jgi:PAS domain S-box-containing protein
MKKRKTKTTQPTNLQKREEEFLHKNSALRKNMPSEDVLNLFEDLQVYQIELENRNDELLTVNKRLQESEERFRKLAEGSFEAIVLHEKGVIFDANKQYYEMFGYNPEELPGKDAISLTATPESAEKIKKQISLGNFDSYEVTGVKKDGTKFPMEIRIKLTSCKGHEVRMAVIRDLTEQKQAEKALRESEARFRDTATMLPSVIIEYGLDGILTYVNPHGYKLAGYNPEEFEEGFHVLQLVAPEEHEKHYERIQRMMQGEKLPPAEYRLLHKDGSIFWGLVTSSLIYKDGEVVGVRTYTIDISERKEAEEALMERTRELEIKTNSLEEINTAMKVLLKKREDDKKEIEDNVLTNIKELVVPYFKKIKKTKLDDQQKAFLSIMESNLNEIISPFTRKMSLKYLNLTPTEIQIANLIKHGNPTKKIAELMNVSPRTIDTHRKNIRRKFGLQGQRGNLRSHLLSLH